MDGVLIEENVERWNNLLSEIDAMTTTQSAQDDKKRKRDEARSFEPSPKISKTTISSHDEASASEPLSARSLHASLALLQHNTQLWASGASAMGLPEDSSALVQGVTTEDVRLDSLRQQLNFVATGKHLAGLASSVLPAASHTATLHAPNSALPSAWKAATPQEALASISAATVRAGAGVSEKVEDNATIRLLERILVLQEQQIQEQRKFQEQSMQAMGQMERLVQTVTLMAAETSSLLRLTRLQN